MARDLKITITGEPGSGKTTISMLLEKFLKENGFEVENFDSDISHGSHYPESQENRIDFLRKNKTHFAIETHSTTFYKFK